MPIMIGGVICRVEQDGHTSERRFVIAAAVIQEHPILCLRPPDIQPEVLDRGLVNGFAMDIMLNAVFRGTPAPQHTPITDRAP